VRRISDFYPDEPILNEFNGLGKDPVTITGVQTIFIPRTLRQAVDFRANFPAAGIVSGATDHGVLHNRGDRPPGDVLCLTSVVKYDNVSVENDVLRIGGGATWTQIEKVVAELFPQYHEIIKRFGSPQIRSVATLAGNLATGSSIADSIPFHLVMDSQIRLISVRGERVIPLCEFYTGYHQNSMADDELIAEVTTPLLKPSEEVVLYKISKRRDMDISTLTLGLWVNVTDGTIENARLAVGGVGPTVHRIPASEQHLIGKRLSESTFRQAGVIATNHIAPWSDVRGGSDYRIQLNENLMLKAYH
jgi:xanthine dehydrogenase small subunit